jgi:phosphatidylglycerophosphate synthase
MVSRFGDVYDHATDVVADVILVVIIWQKYKHIMPVWCIGLMVAAIIMLLMSMGCQQLYCANEKGTEILDSTVQMCPSRESIVWTRFFGPGTWQLLTTLLVIFLHTKASNVKTTPPPPVVSIAKSVLNN